MNPWLIIGFLLAVSGSFGIGYKQGDTHGKAVIQQAWDKEKADQYAEYAKGQAAARQREQELQEAADKLRRDKDAEIRNINARAAALSNSLRNRKERTPATGSLPDTTRSCSGATGAELARGDGEFLAGYAADAARLQTALDQCVKQYEAVRKGSK